MKKLVILALATPLLATSVLGGVAQAGPRERCETQVRASLNERGGDRGHGEYGRGDRGRSAEARASLQENAGGQNRPAQQLRAGLQQLRPILERARQGERTSVDIKAVVQIGGGPVNIQQNSDVNIAGVFQAGGGSTTLQQDGVVNIGHVRQTD